MPSISRQLLSLLLTVVTGQSLAAEPLLCPDLAQARQISSCPAESELRYLFDHKCNDDHQASPGLCVDYAAFRAAKHIALWESQDGEFSGNRSCDAALVRTQVTQATRMWVDRRGAITVLRCEYGGGMVLSMRTRKECRVEGSGLCSASIPCRAQCQ